MKRFKNILFVASQVVEQGAAFERAVALAERNGARLTIAEVFEPIPKFIARQTPHNLRKLVYEHRQAELKKLCQSVERRIKIDAEIFEGRFFVEIVRDVLRSGRDLVVKAAGVRTAGFGRLIDADDMHLLRKCPCPVWLIKPSQDETFDTILAAVAFDGDDETGVEQSLNRQILELSFSLANSENSKLHICHAWKPSYEDMMRNQAGLSDDEVGAYAQGIESDVRQWLDQLEGEAKSWIGQAAYQDVRSEIHLERGNPQKVVPALAQKLGADLVVMGTVGRAGLSGLFMGNTAESVADQIDCSLLAVKPQGFVSPVKLET